MSSTVVIKSWHEIGLNVNPNAVNVKTICPACSETRKNKREKCLSVSPGKGVANCHNCQTSYVIERETQKEYAKPDVKQSPLSARLTKFFKDRHINETTLDYFKVTESKEWMYSRGDEAEGETPCINFNYFQNQELVNVKFRASGKRFRMVSGAKLIFYNLDAIKDADWCAIQEGEIDSMAAYQSGVYKSISVPNGASMGSMKLEYLDNCIDAFQGKEKIIIATDNDEPGRALGEELIRRLGRNRCYTIEYPDGCKDTNDVLIKHGERAVKLMYDNAKPLPLEGVFTAEQLNEGIMDFYRNGFPKGLRLGYKNFDDLLTFRGGELTVVTGIPGSGKSEFIDQIMIRLAARYEWRCGIFSPENQPSSLHAMSLLSKFLGGKTIGKDKVSEMKILKGSEFINDHFFFMKVDEIDVTIDGILDLAEDLVSKKGIKVLLIDPYNYIEHRIPHGQTETQYISELLTKLCNFCRRNDVHGFLIAHPVKIKKDKNTGKYEVATLYDIAGCHDEETEVLTDIGWVRHANLTRNEKVACFDLKSGEIEYMHPSHYHVYPFSGELKHFCGKAMDIAVTPNHRMVIKPHWALKPESDTQRGRSTKYESRDWQFVEAQNVSKSPMILPKSGPFKHLDLLPDRFPLDEGYNTNALFQLVGWYVSEGNETMGSISICQRAENSIHLKKLISSLELNVKEEETNYRRHEKPMYRFRIYARQHPELVKFILDECKSGSDKVKLPSVVWSGNRHQKRLLFEALIEGDGSVSRDGFKYHTCSKQLADDVSRLAFELGYKVTQRFYEKKKKKWMDRYVVYITNRSSEWLMPTNHQSIPYDGNVYCLTVPTGAYVTRRNGSVAITGNSAHFFNKTYNGISVYRDFETNEVTVYVPKVKYKFIGKIGNCSFQYDRDTGRYSDEYGAPFENEFDRYLTKESQVEIHFEEEPPTRREPGQLTDISKLPVANSFDYQQRESAPF